MLRVFFPGGLLDSDVPWPGRCGKSVEGCDIGGALCGAGICADVFGVIEGTANCMKVTISTVGKKYPMENLAEKVRFPWDFFWWQELNS